MPKIPEERKRLVLNTLVARSTRDAIEKLQQDTGESQGLIVDRAIALLAHGEEIEPRARRLVAPDEAPVDLIPPRGGVMGTISVDEDERSATVHVDPASIPGVRRSVVPAGTIRVMCEHCGAKFDSDSRWNKRCEKCEEAGHSRSRYDCAECRLNA